jgi:hypothetical protein
VKLIRMLVVVAFLGIAASVAFADTLPTDPTLLTSGCGRLGQPKCDAYLISSPHQTMSVVLTLDTTAGDTFFGDAIASFVNVSGQTLDGLFTINFTVPPGLSFQGCGSQEGVTSLFTCTGGGSPDSPITGGGTAAFNLTGASICSVDSDDLGGGGEGTPITYASDGDADDDCQAAFTLALKPVAGEILPPTIAGTFSSVPEPSSAVLLLFGLAAGLLTLKGLRTNLA